MGEGNGDTGLFCGGECEHEVVHAQLNQLKVVALVCEFSELEDFLLEVFLFGREEDGRSVDFSPFVVEVSLERSGEFGALFKEIRFALERGPLQGCDSRDVGHGVAEAGAVGERIDSFLSLRAGLCVQGNGKQEEGEDETK